MPAVDHLVYAVPALETGMADIAERTGAEAAEGGSHPGAGTRNALLSFDDDTYFEIISVDPAQPEPAPDRSRPFGVDPSLPARMASFAVHPLPGESIEGVAERMRSLGLPAGPVTSMSRQRPDGVELSWRLTLEPDPDPSTGGVVPFVIDWGSTVTPAKTTPRLGRLSELRINHPDEAVVAALTELDIRLANGRLSVAVGERALVATIDLADGRRIDIG